MHYLSQTLIFLILLALVVVPASAADITVFHQDYTALGSVPDNIAVLNAEEPYNTDHTTSYGGGAVLDRVTVGHSAGEMVVGGLTPGTLVTYTISMDLDRTYWESAVIIRGPGIGVTVEKLASETLRLRSYYNRPDGASTSSYVDVPSSAYPRPFVLTITFDGINKRVTTSAHGYSVTTPLGGKVIPNYNQLSGNILRFDPEPSDRGDLTVMLYSITETVKKAGAVTAIGDPNLVSFGIDGPLAPGTWENSAAAVTASGGRYTVWADAVFLARYPQNVAAVASLLNQGYELGIHFSQRLTDNANPYALMDDETAQVTALFGRQPTSWCSLQNADNGTHAIYAYNKYGMIWRNGQMGVGELPNVPNVYEDTWPWWNAATQAGITIRSFTHETDVDPPIIYSISPQHFVVFLSRYQSRGMTITPFINWYKVGANTRDATFTENADPSTLLNFTAHTNGYPAFVEADLPYADGDHAYNVTGGLSPVRYTRAVDGNMQFYVGDGSTYLISALPLQPPTAGFEANVTSGTAPLTVAFTDTSTGGPTSWNWQFGDGSANATQQHPVHTFAAAGTYIVNLTVSNAFGANATNRTITVTAGVPAPVANFSANVTSGPAPLAVQFTDESTSDGITAWSWDFDNDGRADSAQQNPVHTYIAAGTYTVNFTVANASGSNTSVKTDYITVSEAPVPTPPAADFTANETSGIAPLAVRFTDTSTGDAITGRAWDFTNDGVIDSTGQNPVHTYAAAGTYTVNLTVTNASGSDSEVKTGYITVTEPVVPVPPDANFTANVTTGTAPLTVRFTDTSTGDAITARAWDFTDDGVTDSTEQNPVYSYTAAGTYTVNLTVTNATGSDSEVKAGYITVTVVPNPPTVANFTANITSGTAPLTVAFTDTSTNTPTSWSWQFGDGSANATQQHPVHTFAAAGTYIVNLTASNAVGSNTTSRTITVATGVMAPVANFTANVTTGNAPLTVAFTDHSTNTPTSWAWDFNGDDVVDSTVQNPVYTYPTADIYTVTLTVSNLLGPNTTIRTGMITVTAPTPTATPTQTASIRFTSSPAGGQIYIDGAYKGVTPATIPGITLGIHRAEIALAGYQTWVKSITVTADFVNRVPPYSYNPTLVAL